MAIKDEAKSGGVQLVLFAIGSKDFAHLLVHEDFEFSDLFSWSENRNDALVF